MNIAAIIKEILLHKEFIIIPDIGGFVCEYKPAKISVDKKTINPPSKTIIFKNDLVKDDGELSSYIQKTQKIDAKKANQHIEDFIKQTKAKLDEMYEVEIEGIGTLYMDNNRKYQLRLNLEDNLLLDSFGLTNIEVQPIKKEPVEKEKELVKTNTTSNNKTTTTTNLKTNTNSNNKNNSKDMGDKKKNKTLVWVLTSVAVLIIAALLVIPHTTPYLQTIKIDFANLFNGKDDTYAFNDTSKLGQDIDAQTEKQNALYYEENKSKIDADGDGIPDSLISNYSEYSKFYIIAGSYKRYNNAAKLKKALVKEGYDPEILISTDEGIYRVYYKSFTDRKLALQELYKLQKEKQSEDIWILND